MHAFPEKLPVLQTNLSDFGVPLRAGDPGDEDFRDVLPQVAVRLELVGEVVEVVGGHRRGRLQVRQRAFLQ